MRHRLTAGQSGHAWVAPSLFSLIWLLAGAAVAGEPIRPGIGANKFDLLKQYTGLASGGDGSPRYRRVTRAMARKAIADARDAGIPFLRVSASGFAPSTHGARGDLDLWQSDPKEYWARIDEAMADLEAANVRAVVTFNWNPSQFPAMTGETVADLLSKSDSRSYALAERYVGEFVARYKGRRAVLFYELTNELNLGADLDLVNRCKRGDRPTDCTVKSNYTTSDMIAFTARLAKRVRSIDPERPLSSGYAAQRPNAARRRVVPEWSGSKANPGQDDDVQFEKHLEEVHAPFDLISTHLYPYQSGVRADLRDHDALAVLVRTKRAADRIGKPLFVGEFGDLTDMSGAAGSFAARMIERAVELKVPYSAVWVWEFYQQSTYARGTSPDAAYSIEPGLNDALISRIGVANAMLGVPQVARDLPDRSPPRVVLTWPLDCTVIKGGETLHAAASDNSGAVARVDFWLDELKIGGAASPPYSLSLPRQVRVAGGSQLKARAYDQAGNSSEYRTPIAATGTSACTTQLDR